MQIPLQKENFIRLCLLLSIARKVIKMLFDIEFAPSKLPETLKRFWYRIKLLNKNGVISDRNLPKLKNEHVSSDDFDISLMLVFLRNFATIDTFQQHIDTLTELRTMIEHDLNGEIEDERFEEEWSKGQNAICDLEKCVNGKNILHEECKKWRTACLDSLNYEAIAYALNSIEDLEKTYKQLVSLYNELKDNPIPTSIRDRTAKELKGWEMERMMFCVTKTANEILEAIKTHNFIGIIGSFGTGKTRILRFIALKLKELHDYIIVPIIDDEHKYIKQCIGTGRKYLFVADNFCGKVTYEETEIQKWKDVELNTFNSECKLIFAGRPSVFRYFKSKFISWSTLKTFDLSSEVYDFSKEEKKEIAIMYGINQDKIDKFYQYSFFPLFCQRFKKDGKEKYDLFTNLNSVVTDEIRALENARPHSNWQLSSLVAILALNGRIKKRKLVKNKNGNFKQTLKKICEHCDIKCENVCHNLLSELECMCRSFILQKEEVFVLSSDQLFSFLLDHFFENESTKYAECLIKYSSFSFLKEKFLFSDLPEKKEDYHVGEDHHINYFKFENFSFLGPIRLTLSTKYQKLYFDKVIANWEKGYLNSVFTNINIYHKNFFNFLNKLDLSQQKYLANKLDRKTKSSALIVLCQNIRLCTDYTNTIIAKNVYAEWLLQRRSDDNPNMVEKCNAAGCSPLIVAFRSDNPQIVMSLLEKKANVNKCDNFGMTLLHFACEAGNEALVKILIKKGANFNLIDDHGDTPLHKACKKGNIRCVEMICQEKNKSSMPDGCLNKKNNVGATPLLIAHEEGHSDIVQTLRSVGAKFDG